MKYIFRALQLNEVPPFLGKDDVRFRFFISKFSRYTTFSITIFSTIMSIVKSVIGTYTYLGIFFSEIQRWMYFSITLLFLMEFTTTITRLGDSLLNEIKVQELHDSCQLARIDPSKIYSYTGRIPKIMWIMYCIVITINLVILIACDLSFMGYFYSEYLIQLTLVKYVYFGLLFLMTTFLQIIMEGKLHRLISGENLERISKESLITIYSINAMRTLLYVLCLLWICLMSSYFFIHPTMTLFVELVYVFTNQIFIYMMI